MNKPHRNAEFLKAYADGQQIEFRNPMMARDCWEECGKSTLHLLEYGTACEFRIKPEREYPKTSLDMAELYSIYTDGLRKPDCNPTDLARIANAAIRRYIDDQEGKE